MEYIGPMLKTLALQWTNFPWNIVPGTIFFMVSLRKLVTRIKIPWKIGPPDQFSNDRAIAKRFPHGKNQLSGPGSVFQIVIYYITNCLKKLPGAES